MNSEQPPINPEKEPATYENVLEAFKALRVAGVDTEGTFDPDTSLYTDPAVQAAFDLKEEWELQGATDDLEGAKNKVKAARLLLDAGYNDPHTVKEALMELNDEYEFMLKDKGGVEDEMTEILRAGMDSLIEKPSEKFEAVIKEIISKAKSGERKSVIDAVRQIATTISKNNPDFKNFFKTPEGKKKLAYIKKLEPVVDQIYKDVRDRRENPVDPNILDSIEE